MIRRISPFLSLLLPLIIVVGCASEAQPPGGPEDKTPPSVVHMYPENGAVNVSSDVEIQVEFSEYLSSRSVEPSLFISPYTGVEYEVNVSRRTVNISFDGSLQDSTTYIITFGTTITDLRGNKLSQSFSLAFSTGDQIDQGVMAGQVYRNEAAEGDVSILAYLRSDQPIDSLMNRRPDYKSNPNQNGVFTFDNMVLGEYFFIGIQDQNNNNIYDPGEWTGIPPKTYWEVRDSLHTNGLRMRLFQYPADSLILSKVEQLNRHQIVVGLNRPPVQTVTGEHLIFINSEGDTLSPAAVMSGEQEGEYFVEHYDMQVDSSYLFLARNLTGRFGLPFGYQRERRDIEISSKKDTLALAPPAISIQDSATGVQQSREFVVQWPRAVHMLPPDSILQITGLPPDTFNIVWNDDRTLVVKPDSLWPGETWIQWTLLDSVITDLRDSTYSDSITTGAFQIESGGDYGMISGTVRNLDSTWAPELVNIRATPGGESEEQNVIQTPVYQDSLFMFERVPPGNYNLLAYYDADTSGAFNYGRPVPFETSEKFVIFPDTMSVRARWESSGIIFKFPGMNE